MNGNSYRYLYLCLDSCFSAAKFELFLISLLGSSTVLHPALASRCNKETVVHRTRSLVERTDHEKVQESISLIFSIAESLSLFFLSRVQQYYIERAAICAALGGGVLSAYTVEIRRNGS